MPGRFLVMEGIDGSGKSSQVERLHHWLPRSRLMPAGAKLLVTREPGGTPLGEQLRPILFNRQLTVHSRAELLLFAADRAQHVEDCIRPALNAGHWVVSDRFSGSTVAYQGYGRGCDLELIHTLEQMATGGLTPDLTLWLDLPPQRARTRKPPTHQDRFEGAGLEFMQRVADGFQQLAVERDWWRIPAGQPCAAVEAAIQDAIRRTFTV
ncbi:MAG: thymidylate kinase [Candidatus Synechococcus spongiarum SP3]|uniref:Thymidylate kinase n=1 Tax=Candidatus Synechococcus spongiarum SP3 TaxID=1604020 RepID=A0A0G2IW00_9SYNE|nr:MAG: thymidylate kinase [Candidatus Synechococcus spongiarum SP3]